MFLQFLKLFYTGMIYQARRFSE